MKLIVRLFCFALVCVSVACEVKKASGQSFLTNGLVAFYPFSGDANDASGYGNNGTVHGATLTSNRFGTQNSAYYFPAYGTNYISIPDSPSLGILSNVTITAWIQTGGGGYAQPFIAGKYNYYLRLDDTSSNPSFSFVVQPTTGVVSSPRISLNSNVWIFVAGTYDGQSMKIYTNGVIAAQLAASGAIGNLNESFGIGENLNDFSDFFAGSISEVRVYNRALSANEIVQLHGYRLPQLTGLILSVRPSFSYLYVGTNYQLQVSTDLNVWTNHGAAFIATNSFMIYSQYFDVNNWNSLFFRLKSSQ